MRTRVRKAGLRKESARPYKRITRGIMPDPMRRPPSSGGFSIRLSLSENLTAKSLGNSIGRRSSNQGRLWSGAMIRIILMNENYIGNIVYNLTTRPIGQKLINNPQDRWIRGLALIAQSSIPVSLHAHKKLMAERRVQVPEDQMLLTLRTALHRKGKLSWSIINNTPGLPSAGHAPSISDRCEKSTPCSVYDTSRHCDWIDTRVFWPDVLAKHAA